MIRTPIEQRHARSKRREMRLAVAGWCAFAAFMLIASSWLNGWPFGWQKFLVGP